MAAKGEAVGEREIVVTRTFDAPRETVWAAWTDAKRLDQWWGPTGFRNETHAMDFRVGGVWRYTMHGPDGTDYPNWIRYREIAAPSRLVYDHGSNDDNVHFEASATFEDLGEGKTRVTMRSLFPTREARDHVVHVYGAIEGGKQTLERMAEHLAALAAEGDSLPRAMTLTRVFNAPLDLVFRAWTDPKHVAQWWGPHAFTSPVCEWEAKPGGKIYVEMTWQDGTPHPMPGEFREVVKNERIVFVTRAFVDENGVPALEALNTVTFAALGDKTKVTVNAQVTRAAPEMKPALDGMRQGWSESLEKLAGDIAGSQRGLTTMRAETVMFITRVFDAPRALVFDALTKPEHVRRWYGPRGVTMVSCEIDFRVGGRYRYVLRSKDGHEAAFSGEYRTIERPERIVSTWWLEAIPGAETLDTATLHDVGGKTRLSVRVEFPSAEHLEGWAQSGAEAGMAETYDRLAELLGELA